MEENLPRWAAPYTPYSRHIHTTRFRRHLSKRGFQTVRLLHLNTDYAGKLRYHMLWHPKLFILGYIGEWYHEHPSKIEGIEWDIDECTLNFELRYPDEKMLKSSRIGLKTPHDTDKCVVHVTYHWSPRAIHDPYSFDQILKEVSDSGGVFVKPEVLILPENILGEALHASRPQDIRTLPKYLHKYIYGLEPVLVPVPKVKIEKKKTEQTQMKQFKNNPYHLLFE